MSSDLNWKGESGVMLRGQYTECLSSLQTPVSEELQAQVTQLNKQVGIKMEPEMTEIV